MALLSDLHFVELARVLERNQALAMRDLAREVIAMGEGFLSFDEVGSPLNKAVGVGLDGALSARDLDTIVEFFTARGVEPKLELTAFAPPALLDALADRGFVLRAVEDVLVRDLRPHETFASIFGATLGPGVAVEQVDANDAAAVYEFADASGSGFVPEGEPTSVEMIELATKTARDPRCDAFVVKRDGRVVGGGASASRDGVTALFGASVRPEHRRLGLQQALIAARLARGIERGSSLGTITSRPGIPTERNAMRLGFRMGYARICLGKPGPGLIASP